MNGIYQEMLDTNLKKVMIEAEGSRKDAFVELLKRKETESKVASAFVKVCSHLFSPSNLCYDVLWRRTLCIHFFAYLASAL